jgi:hypothetical protein
MKGTPTRANDDFVPFVSSAEINDRCMGTPIKCGKQRLILTRFQPGDGGDAQLDFLAVSTVY